VHWEYAERIGVRVLSSQRVEQDPNRIAESVLECGDRAVEYAKQENLKIAAMGLSIQRSGVLAWRRGSLKVLAPLISHRDRRFATVVRSLVAEHRKITALTGLPVLPNFSAPKIASLQRRFPGPGSLVGTLDSFLLARLVGTTSFATEHSMAARSMLYDLAHDRWSPELCKIFNVFNSRLAKVVPSLNNHGSWHGIAVTAMLGDQQAALYAARCCGTKALLNLGTIASMMCEVSDHNLRLPGFTTSVLASSQPKKKLERRFLIEAVLAECAPFVNYLSRITGVQMQDLDRSTIDIKASSPLVYWEQCGGEWRPYCEEPKDQRAPLALPWIITSGFEHLAARIACKILELQDAGLLKLGSTLLVSGGVAKSGRLLQLLANLTGLKIYRTTQTNLSALGAALAAAGVATDGLLGAESEQRFLPDRDVNSTKLSRERLRRWKLLREMVSRSC